MKKLFIGTLLALAVSTAFAADISVTTSLDRNLPWIDVLKQLDNNPTVAAAFAARLAVSGIVPSANIATWMGTPSSANFAAAITDETGSGKVVFGTSPTLITPTLGVATATSINGNTITTGTGTLTLGAGKTTTFDHTSTFTTTDAQTYTFPTTSATLARTDAANTFTGVQTMTSAALISPVITTGLTASGSAANDFSASTGTFKTSTGAGTLGGDTAVAAGKNLTLASGAGGFDASAASGVTKTTTGTTSVGGALAVKTSSISGAGALALTSVVSKVTTTGGAQALTLADGVDGQIKIVVHEVDGGSAVLTPTTKTGFTTITFTNVGDSCMLVFVTTRGWMIVSLNGAVAA